MIHLPPERAAEREREEREGASSRTDVEHGDESGELTVSPGALLLHLHVEIKEGFFFFNVSGSGAWTRGEDDESITAMSHA